MRDNRAWNARLPRAECESTARGLTLCFEAPNFKILYFFREEAFVYNFWGFFR
jgi:hypothetical protein